MDMFQKGGCFVWEESQETSFGLIKQALVSAATLTYQHHLYQLQEFLLWKIHRIGRLHTDADAFSRYPVDAP